MNFSTTELFLPFEDRFIARRPPLRFSSDIFGTSPSCTANFFSVCRNYHLENYLYLSKKSAVSSPIMHGNFRRVLSKPRRSVIKNLQKVARSIIMRIAGVITRREFLCCPQTDLQIMRRISLRNLTRAERHVRLLDLISCSRRVGAYRLRILYLPLIIILYSRRR